MGFFKKQRLRLEDLANAEEAIPINTVLKNKAIKQDCPPLFRDTGLCVCVNCPRLGKCKIEMLSKSLKCTRIIRACSIKAFEKGDPPVCAELILEEFFDHINGKYLRL
jgi:hypothetical protein